MDEVLKGVIDRFEGDFVSVEVNGETIDYPKSIFPKNAEVGDVVYIKENTVTIHKDETIKLRKEIEDLMKELWED